MSAGHDPSTPNGRLLARNLRLLAAFRVMQMAMFPIAIVPLYWRDELGFTVAEIFLVHALFGLFTACLEFPGGYLADRIGYRTAMGVASLCSLAGWLVLGGASAFGMVLVGEFLLACSLSLTSGTDAALMYESLAGLGRESEFARWFGRNRSLGAASEGTAALAAGLLFSLWPPLPFFVQALLWVVNAMIVFALVACGYALRASWLLLRGDVAALDRDFGPRSTKDEVDEELQDLKARSGDPGATPLSSSAGAHA